MNSGRACGSEPSAGGMKALTVARMHTGIAPKRVSFRHSCQPLSGKGKNRFPRDLWSYRSCSYRRGGRRAPSAWPARWRSPGRPSARRACATEPCFALRVATIFQSQALSCRASDAVLREMATVGKARGCAFLAQFTSATFPANGARPTSIRLRLGDRLRRENRYAFSA